MKIFAVPLAVMAFVSAAGAQFESPDLKAGKVHVNRVVLTPVVALIFQLDSKTGPFDLGKPMAEESRQVEKDLLPVITAALKNVGFTVNDTAFSPDALDSNKELGHKVELAQVNFAKINVEIDRNPKKYANFSMSLGDSFSELHAPDDSDAIVIAYVHGAIETKGKKLSNLIGINSTGGWDMRIGIINPKTGEIMFIARPSGSNDIVKEPAKIAPQIEKSFKNFIKDNAASSGTQK